MPHVRLLFTLTLAAPLACQGDLVPDPRRAPTRTPAPARRARPPPRPPDRPRAPAQARPPIFRRRARASRRARALAGNGATLAVGAFGEDSAATGIGGDQADNTAANAGAVYVFRAVGGVWSQQAYIKAANAEAADMFGQNVALSADGDTLAAGAHLEDSAAVGVGGDPKSNALSASGAAHVFVYGGGAWSQQVYLKASNPTSSGNFGTGVSLSTSGDLLAVGAANDPSAAVGVGGHPFNDLAPLSGAVTVFERAQGAWSQRAYVKASNTGTFDQWGSGTVQLSGDGRILAVSTSGEDSAAKGLGGDLADNSAPTAGAVYVY